MTRRAFSIKAMGLSRQQRASEKLRRYMSEVAGLIRLICVVGQFGMSVFASICAFCKDPSAIGIAIADDHAIFRDGLRKLLAAEPGFGVTTCVRVEAARFRSSRTSNATA